MGFMNRRFTFRLICILIATSFASAKEHSIDESVTRDWAQYPAIVSIPAPQTLYALGDVHGDYDRLVQLLVAGKIIDPAPASPEAVRWSAGHAVLVCTGDMIDRYNHTLPVLALMRALQPQALAAGGRVICALGNHEANFLASQGEDKKPADFAAELTAAGISPAEVALGHDAGGIGAWLRNLPAGAKVGDWFFCHAGNTGGEMLDDLNAKIQQQVTAQGWGAPILADPNSMLEARMHPRPWWDWDGAEPTLKDADTAPENKPAEGATEEQRLRKTIEALGAKHLVFGHQPGKVTFLDGSERGEGQMYGKYDGLVFMIDTGMSRGVQAGRGALLKIDPLDPHPSATAVYADGTKTVLWP
jgi:hypothetical protein